MDSETQQPEAQADRAALSVTGRDSHVRLAATGGLELTRSLATPRHAGESLSDCPTPSPGSEASLRPEPGAGPPAAAAPGRRPRLRLHWKAVAAGRCRVVSDCHEPPVEAQPLRPARASRVLGPSRTGVRVHLSRSGSCQCHWQFKFAAAAPSRASAAAAQRPICDLRGVAILAVQCPGHCTTVPGHRPAGEPSVVTQEKPVIRIWSIDVTFLSVTGKKS